MKPKQLLISNLENHLGPLMAEQGFKFLRSGVVRFRRTLNGFNQEVHFLPSHHNEENDCSFQCGFHISSKDFADWLTESGFEEKDDGHVCAGGEMMIPNWPTKKPKFSLRPGAKLVHRFRFTNSKRDKRELTILKRSIAVATVAYLDHLSNWDHLVNEVAVHKKWHLMETHRRAPALYMLGRRDEARKAFDDELAHMVEIGQGSSPQFDWHKELYNKMFRRGYDKKVPRKRRPKAIKNNHGT